MTPAPRRRRILVIDDDPAIREIITNALAEFDVRCASFGEDTPEQAAALRPDVVLLDVNLPGISGFEVCRRLRGRKETRETPVLFMTGLSSDDSFKESIQAGGNAWIAKPFDVSELRERIRQLLAAPPEGKRGGV